MLRSTASCLPDEMQALWQYNSIVFFSHTVSTEIEANDVDYVHGQAWSGGTSELTSEMARLREL